MLAFEVPSGLFSKVYSCKGPAVPPKTVEKKFARPLATGDTIGVGFRPKQASVADGASRRSGSKLRGFTFFINHNNEELPLSDLDLTFVPENDLCYSQVDLYPAILVMSTDAVVTNLAITALPGMVEGHGLRPMDLMAVDTGEDEWQRLHDVRLTSNVLEYVGRGQCEKDVGLAQARTPIGTRNHYFEIEIVDPGYNCYIAIGLAKKNYPKNRHPGWEGGSIAYHADDGKVFEGSGHGASFGPRCHKGDIMGCGVLFPRNYECKSDSDEELDQQAGVVRASDGLSDLSYISGVSGGGAGSGDSDRDDGFSPGSFDDYYNESNDEGRIAGVVVGIYFTRNGEMIGRKDIRIPKGGLYPTIGMMSREEKVRVDLRPLS